MIVAPVHSTSPARLLNYLTAPHVLIWSAALCSSSVPGIYAPSPLMVREPDGEVLPEDGGHILYQDGSMDSDLPMSQLAELFNVNHFKTIHFTAARLLLQTTCSTTTTTTSTAIIIE